MNATKASTQTVQPRTWCFKGPIDGLREHSTARVHQLPDPPTTVRLCGGGARREPVANEIQLDDPTVSREHAEVVPLKLDGELVWKIHDLKSKNGLRCDGKRRKSFVLRPGVEVELGSLKLIPENEELRHLLSILRLLLGWAPDRQERVDQAMRCLRDWAELEADLVIVGDGDLVPLVRRLHNLVLGTDVPFTTYVPTEHAVDVVKHAAAGTLCVRPPESPAHAQEAAGIVELVRAAEYRDRPQLVLCAADNASAAIMMAGLERLAVIHVPPLADRREEFDHIVQGYAAEIAREHGLPGTELTMHDVDQLRVQPYRYHTDVEDDALRAVMLRRWGPREGAAKIGITRPSLVSWAVRRGLNT